MPLTVYPEHLHIAWERVRKGSAAAGIDGITPELFVGIQHTELRSLEQQIRRETYAPKPAKGFYLKKPSGGQRLIGIPTVRDRIVQRYLLHQIYPHIEAQFTDSCYAYRPGYSIYQAVAGLLHWYQPDRTWLLKADIHQFFDQLHWPLLLTALEQVGVAGALLTLLEQQLRAGIVIRGQWSSLERGVLQGGVLSGALANLYLSSFDGYCLQSGLPLIRYGDDFVIPCASQAKAEQSLARVTERLSQLGLTLQPQKTQILPPGASFTFLGHQFAQGQVVPPILRAPATKPPPRPPKQGKPVVCSRVRRAPNPTFAKATHYWSTPMTTLYVSDQGANLRVKQQQFQVYCGTELRCQVPVNQVSHIFLFGCCHISHGAVSLALTRRIPVIFLSHQGRYFGRLETAGQAKIDYLSAQVQRSLDPEFSLAQARSIVLGKLHNSRVVLQRLNRRRNLALVSQAISQLATIMKTVAAEEVKASLFGHEGQAAQVYFRALGALFIDPFRFEQRNRRPPKDPVNSLLSLGYTLLHQNLSSLVEAIGLHTHYGNLHVPRQNHPALVCDLVEEFRAPVVESLVAYLINSKLLSPEDFTPPDPQGGVYLYPDAFKVFIKHWEEKLQSEITHPHTGYKVTYRRCLELQVWEYVAVLKGEQPLYRPMLWTY
jgi:CRISP-associated protein Cas1